MTTQQDARGARVEVRVPCCQQVRRLDLAAVAVEVIRTRCLRCRALWQLKSTPIRASKDAVIRRFDWLCLEGSR